MQRASEREVCDKGSGNRGRSSQAMPCHRRPEVIVLGRLSKRPCEKTSISSSRNARLLSVSRGEEKYQLFEAAIDGPFGSPSTDAQGKHHASRPRREPIPASTEDVT